MAVLLRNTIDDLRHHPSVPHLYTATIKAMPYQEIICGFDVAHNGHFYTIVGVERTGERTYTIELAWVPMREGEQHPTIG